MTDLLCKLWRWFLNLLTQLLEVIAEAIEAVVDIALDLLDGVTDSLLSSPLGLLLLGVGGVWLLSSLGVFGRDDDDDKTNRMKNRKRSNE